MHFDHFHELLIFYVDKCIIWCQVKKMSSSFFNISTWSTSHYFFEHCNHDFQTHYLKQLFYLISFHQLIIIINSYTFVTSIKSTHEKLYAIYIEWTKLSEIENHSLFIQLLHAFETIIMKLCIKLVHIDCMLKNEWFSHFKLL